MFYLRDEGKLEILLAVLDERAVREGEWLSQMTSVEDPAFWTLDFQGKLEIDMHDISRGLEAKQ